MGRRRKARRQPQQLQRQQPLEDASRPTLAGATRLEAEKAEAECFYIGDSQDEQEEQAETPHELADELWRRAALQVAAPCGRYTALSAVEVEEGEPELAQLAGPRSTRRVTGVAAPPPARWADVAAESEEDVLGPWRRDAERAAAGFSECESKAQAVGSQGESKAMAVDSEDC